LTGSAVDPYSRAAEPIAARRCAPLRVETNETALRLQPVVRAFQRSIGLSASGKISPELLLLLRN